MKAIICVGISGSGKSTWADSQLHIPETYYPVAIVNRDELRWEYSGKRGWNGPNAYKFNKHTETRVTEGCEMYLKLSAERGYDVIISDTNLSPVFREKLIERCKGLGYDVEIREFPISFQEACKRDSTRGVFSVGEAVLMKQWEQWLLYWQDKGEGMWA